MSNPILALIPSGYQGGSTPKVYSILPNDGSGDFTYDRNTPTDGTRVRKDGLIEQMGNDIPRLDWLNSNCPSLLLEPQRTNLAHYSEQTDNAYWNKTGLSVTANQTTSPDGTLSADKLQRTSTSSSFVSKAFTKTASAVQNFTLSVFVKKGDSRHATLSLQGDYPDRAYLQYDFEQGTINASIDFEDFTILSTKAENYNNGWVRLSLAVSTDAHSSITVLISPKNDVVTTALSDSSDSCFMYVWGIQLEKDTYSTTYIKTEGGLSTRNADVCLNGGSADLFNVSELSLLIDATNFAPPLNDFCYISLTDGQSSPINMIRLTYEETRIIVTVYNSDNSELNYNITSVTANQRNKVLLTFNGNEAKVYFNGVLKNTSTGIALPSGLDSLSFSNRTENARNFEGKIHDVRVYDRVLTEAEAIKLTK